MVTTFFPPYNFGGDGIYIYRLSNELARRGHAIDVVHCTDAYRVLEKRGPKGDYPNHPNVTVHRLRSGFGLISPLLTQQTSYPFFKGRKIKDLIDEKNFDIIHFHNMSLIGLQTLLYGDAIKLYTMHEHWLVCPMHVLWKFGKEPCTKRNCIPCQIVGNRPVQWWRYTDIMKKTIDHIDAFISPSVFTKRKHHEMGFNKPITQIPYFIPTSDNGHDSMFDNSFKYNRSYFLFVGRLEKIKGLQNLIPVFKNYKKCDLLVAGDGEYEHTLRQQAKGIPNIKFLGRLPYQKLLSLYQNALAVIVPSLCYEVFGIIIIESFIQRTPVIVNNLGALPEVVTQSGGGFIYNNEDDLIAHMDKFFQNPDLRRVLGDKGYHAYLKYWSENYHINKYYHLIKEVADRKNLTNPAIETLREEVMEQMC